MNAFYNLARVTTATIGTGALTLGAAVFGHLTFAQAGVPNGAVVSYGINDGANSEVGWGVYNSTGPTLTRNVYRSTGAGNNTPISLSGSAQVFINPLAEDFVGTGSGSLVFADSPAFIGNPTAPTPATGDNDTSIATTAFVKAQGPYLPLAGGALSGGINFGSVVGASATDLSKHIALYASAYGFSVTSSRLNYNVGSGASHVFLVAGVDEASLDANQFYLSNRLVIGSVFAGLSGNGLAIAPAAISRTYNLYTDAANFELAYNGEWFGNAARYGSDKAGTGINRDVNFLYGGAVKLQLNANGVQVIAGTRFSVGTPGISSTNYATTFGVRDGTTIGTTAGSYLYSTEFQYFAGNIIRLQIAPYRRYDGAAWQGSGFRFQYAVDNSFTDGSRSYVEIGTTNAGTGQVAIGGRLWLEDDLYLTGATSGSLVVRAAAVAGANTLTFPAGTTDLSATGGAGHFLKQNSAGGAITVEQPAASDLSNGVTGSGAIVLADSPVLIGNPTAPTPLTADNDTSIATTAFVKAQGYVGGGPYLPLAGGALSGPLTGTTVSTSASITAGTGSNRALSLIGGTTGTANRPKLAAASGSGGLLLTPNDDGGGAIIRLISESSSIVELAATDATGNFSYQRLKLNGATLQLLSSGSSKLDYGITTAGLWTFGAIARIPGGGAATGLNAAGGVLQFQNLDPTPGNWTRIQFLDSDGDNMVILGHKNVDHVANNAAFAIGVKVAPETGAWEKIDFNLLNAAAWTLYTKTAINGLLAWGGAGAFTSASPALKRSGAGLQVRLADDSGFAMLEADRIGIGIVPPPSVTLAIGIGGFARSYNTYTDATNHEYADLGNWVSNTVYYGSGKIGTGLARDVIFTRGGSIYMLFDTNGISLGTTLIQRPGPIVNPVGNGDLVVQATSNTQLTFKYKGSDGVVRSASLTLA